MSMDALLKMRKNIEFKKDFVPKQAELFLMTERVASLTVMVKEGRHSSAKGN